MTPAPSHRWLWIMALAFVAVLGVGGFLYFRGEPRPVPPPPVQAPSDPVDIAVKVHNSLRCLPTNTLLPTAFRRSIGGAEVERGYRFAEQSALPVKVPPMDAVIRYYQALAHPKNS